VKQTAQTTTVSVPSGQYTYDPAWTYSGTGCFMPGDDAYAVGNHYYNAGTAGTAAASTQWVNTSSTACSGPGHLGYIYTRNRYPVYTTTTQTTYVSSIVLERCVAGTVTQVKSISGSFPTLAVNAGGDVITVQNADGSPAAIVDDATHNTATLVGAGLGGPTDRKGSAIDDLAVTPLVFSPSKPTLLTPAPGSYADIASGDVVWSAQFNDDNPADLPTARRTRRKLLTDSGYEYEQADGTFGAVETDLPVTGSSRRVQWSYAADVWTNDEYAHSTAFKDTDTGDWSPYADDAIVVGNAAPNLSISAPIGTVVDTNRPTISLAYDDPDGDPQKYVQAKVFTDAAVTAAGFDPDVAQPVWDSLRLPTDGDEIQIGVTLDNAVKYWVYAKAWQDGGLSSGWVGSQFSVQVTPPAQPTVAAVYDPTIGGTRVSVTGHDNLASANLASAEDDVAWSATTNCDVVLSTDQAATGAKSARVTVTADGDAVVTSEEVDVQGIDKLATAMAKVLAGTTPTTVVLSARCFDDQGAEIGTVTIADVTEQSGLSSPPPPPPPPSSDYDLYFSVTPDRAEPRLLDGQSVSGSVYVQVLQTDSVSRVDFWLDAPTTDAPRRTESTPPFDFNGGQVVNGVDRAVPFDTTALTVADHVIRARVTLSDGTLIDRAATFAVVRDVPAAPSNVGASSTTVGQIDVTWAAPPSTGGSPVTSYTVTATPVLGGAATTVTTADGVTLSASLTGLTGGAVYDVTVHATNAIGDGDDSAPVRVTAKNTTGSGGSTDYGPVGDEWPARTPTMQDPIDVTVNPDDWNALNGAILNNRTKPRLVVAIGDGTINPDSSSKLVAAVAGLGDRAQNVLIRPLHIGGVKCNGLFRVNAGGVTIAHMVGGGFYLNGDKNNAAVNNVLDKGSQSKVNGVVGYELCGNVALNRTTTGSDRIQIIGTNGKIWRQWLEGKDVNTSISPTPHVDGMQVLGASGYLQISNEYHGGSGNNAAFFYKQDVQNGLPEPTITLDTFWCGQSPQGTNDITIILYAGGMSLTMNKVISQRNLRFRNHVSDTADLSFMTALNVTDCQAQSYQLLKDSDGKKIVNNPTTGVTLLSSAPAAPKFVRPTWWRSDLGWDSI